MLLKGWRWASGEGALSLSSSDLEAEGRQRLKGPNVGGHVISHVRSVSQRGGSSWSELPKIKKPKGSLLIFLLCV